MFPENTRLSPSQQMPKQGGGTGLPFNAGGAPPRTGGSFGGMPNGYRPSGAGGGTNPAMKAIARMMAAKRMATGANNGPMGGSSPVLSRGAGAGRIR